MPDSKNPESPHPESQHPETKNPATHYPETRYPRTHGDWEQALVSGDSSIRKVIERINTSRMQIALVTDGNRRLLGTATDGDVRRGLIEGISLDAAVTEIMNHQPKTVSETDSRATKRALMDRHQINQVPITSASGIVIGLETLHDLLLHGHRNNQVLIVAGGFGKRLAPLTATLPKPMLQVGGKPILANLLDGMREQGLWRFNIAVHYMADVIEAYFGDGSRWNVEISYLHEEEPLGTAGALRLLRADPADGPVVMANGDLMTTLDYGRLLDFHNARSADVTVCVRKYDYQVPFGVVEIDPDGNLTGIAEKPVQDFYVNAGVYVLNQAQVMRVGKGPLDMPALITREIEAGAVVASYPIHEYWMDLGVPADLEQAQKDAPSVLPPASPSAMKDDD